MPAESQTVPNHGQKLEDTVIHALYSARSLGALHESAAPIIARLTGNGAVAVLLTDGLSEKVELVFGADCPLQPDQRIEPESWQADDIWEIPMEYAGDSVGVIRGQFGTDPSGTLAEFERFAAHLSVAFVNIRLNAEALRTTEQYCASLQAFEEGVVLFQEQNPDAIGARFLSLVTQLLGTPVGALLILEDVDDVTSELRVDQVQGLPAGVVESIRERAGAWWPQTILHDTIDLLERDPTTSEFAPLDPTTVPEVMHNIVHCPLQYHGVHVGVALAFNVAEHTGLGLGLERARRLGELGAAIFHRLSLERDSLKTREFETQLSIASTIQARLIPETAPKWDQADCAWASKPAQFVGGDYVDLLETDEFPLQAVVADVSGHGIDSALLMASFRASMRAISSREKLGNVLAVLNREVCGEVGDTGMFITAAVLRIAQDGRSCEFASAGHNPCYVYRHASGEIDQFDSTGPSLGMFAGMDFECTEFSIEPGDVALLYTDGIVEATDRRDEMFGEERLIELLTENGAGPAQNTLDAVLSALAEFVGEPGYEDDVSIAVVRIRP